MKKQEKNIEERKISNIEIDEAKEQSPNLILSNSHGSYGAHCGCVGGGCGGGCNQVRAKK